MFKPLRWLAVANSALSDDSVDSETMFKATRKFDRDYLGAMPMTLGSYSGLDKLFFVSIISIPIRFFVHQ